MNAPDRLTLYSPAKINLYLKVASKRPDGFHNIVTLFERINLMDTLTFRKNKSGKIKIKCDHPHVPCGPKNLVYKVAQMYQEDFGISDGVSIKIKKRIPVAAGLAGGSTNCASALMGLNQLWNIGLSRRQLLVYARKLGSDVAFFLHDTSWGLGTERGDKIRPLKIGARFSHILVVPRVKLYSGQVYRGVNLQLTKTSDDVNILIRYLRNNDILAASRLLSNDLEPVVLKQCPRLLKIQQKLKSLNVQGVMVSGSGPSVFGLAESENQAKSLRSILARKYRQVFAVQTL